MLTINTILFQIIDPYLASYVLEKPMVVVIPLAQTSISNEAHKLAMLNIIEERELLSDNFLVR